MFSVLSRNIQNNFHIGLLNTIATHSIHYNFTHVHISLNLRVFGRLAFVERSEFIPVTMK